jgi:hypothetical protein
MSLRLAVRPSTAYDLEIFYRADLKTSAAFKWEVVDAASSTQLAMSDAISNTSEWAPLHIKFKTSSTDGIIIRLMRDNCGPVCPVTGTIGFDDIALRSAGDR